VPYPGITRPDLCPIPAATEQIEHAESACGGLTVDGRALGSERHASGPMPRPAGQAAMLPTIVTNEQRDDGVPEASAVNDAAVAAYRLSVQADNPLSERPLAQMFGRTSRRWARVRIADARQASSIQDSPGASVMA